ncbi:MAG: GNAT family N-acetyltransferase [Armatimonadetes bacterium]|jgi:GNAT superfamily N-acetyltransferase|nr:GNAT family N-acetyltransferase [Armatimonadota bacterium]CUU38523.1 Acetyltransferase (GNAT) family protein [Armatimonadetes bacterium DC]
MQVRIEPVQPDQVGLLLELIRQLAEYERRLDQVQATEADLRAALFREGSPVRAVLAWRGQEAVGYALYYPVFSTFRGQFALYLEDIFVLPAYRGQGIGLALMRYLAREALRHGYDRIEWQVLDWNTPAIEFYHRLGATPKETEWVPYKLEGEALRRLAAG